MTQFINIVQITMLKGWILLIQLIIISTVNSVIVVPTSSAQNCDNKQPLSKFINYDNADLIQEDDITMIITGNGTAVVQLSQLPLQVLIFAERKVGDKWIDAQFKRYIPDFCNSMFSRAEVWYPLTKNFVGEERVCPPKIGVSFRNVSFLVEIKYNFVSFFSDNLYFSRLYDKIKS